MSRRWIAVAMAAATAAGCGSDGRMAGDGGVDQATHADQSTAAVDQAMDSSTIDQSVADSSMPDLTLPGSDMACQNCSMPSFLCCNGQCIDSLNDINNCGQCAHKCGGQNPYCNLGACGMPPCNGVTCLGGQLCCGDQCCNAGYLCCDVPGPVSSGPSCQLPDPMTGTCPPSTL
jgi:hypothetical protein